MDTAHPTGFRFFLRRVVVGKDYRIGLIAGSILAGFALLWVATRPSLTPQPQPVPSARDNKDPAKADHPAMASGTSQGAPTGKSVPDKLAGVVSGGSPRPAVRDTNTPAGTTRVHTVRSGETLSAIAQQYYGSANAWRRILDANKAIKDAHKIAPGTKLVIPE